MLTFPSKSPKPDVGPWVVLSCQITLVEHGIHFIHDTAYSSHSTILVSSEPEASRVPWSFIQRTQSTAPVNVHITHERFARPLHGMSWLPLCSESVDKSLGTCGSFSNSSLSRGSVFHILILQSTWRWDNIYEPRQQAYLDQRLRVCGAWGGHAASRWGSWPSSRSSALSTRERSPRPFFRK